MTKVRVGLLFGGCSGEHEVSISSARAIAQALSAEQNANKYELLPVYIQKDGVWQSGEISQGVLESGQALQLTEFSKTSLPAAATDTPLPATKTESLPFDTGGTEYSLV